MKRESAFLDERSAERIRADLERTRKELAHSVQALRLEVARTVEWREWFRRYPAVFLITAFTVGFALGARRRD